TFFDISIKLASGGNPDAYKQHDNKESGYTVFDSEECYKLGANELIPVVPSDKNRCLSTMQLLISKDYKESYVECQRKYTKIDGSINKPVCTVWSRVKPGIFMIYRIPEIFIADRSWVGNDEIIKKYILSLTEQGR
ncbi:hypothetical protein, partial [Pseudomonas nitroreducens]|uniref:hypothetical protein n=1 Tax=Pseudomonas nitroreducens TaxID=46680 RepID=UPI003D2DD6AC